MSLLALRSKHFNPQAWFGEDTSLWLSKPFTLTRHGNYVDARFNTTNPPIAFYKMLVSRFPDIRITYEYFGGSTVGHGCIDATSARPNDYTPKSPSELAAIKGSRVWKLHLGEGEDPKQLIRAYLEAYKYDDDGDCIMICV